jgi:hypothetical protein
MTSHPRLDPCVRHARIRSATQQGPTRRTS